MSDHRWRRRPVKTPERWTLCSVCGHELFIHPDDYLDDPNWKMVESPQHSRCNDEIIRAYELGQASVLPLDDPYGITIRQRYGKVFG